MDMAFAVICDRYEGGEIAGSSVLDRFWELDAAKSFMDEQVADSVFDQGLSIDADRTRFLEVPLVDDSGKVRMRYHIDEQEQR